jgi:hypothetical protein
LMVHCAGALRAPRANQRSLRQPAPFMGYEIPWAHRLGKERPRLC